TGRDGGGCTNRIIRSDRTVAGQIVWNAIVVAIDIDANSDTCDPWLATIYAAIVVIITPYQVTQGHWAIDSKVDRIVGVIIGHRIVITARHNAIIGWLCAPAQGYGCAANGLTRIGCTIVIRIDIVIRVGCWLIGCLRIDSIACTTPITTWS